MEHLAYGLCVVGLHFALLLLQEELLLILVEFFPEVLLLSLDVGLISLEILDLGELISFLLIKLCKLSLQICQLLLHLFSLIIL